MQTDTKYIVTLILWGVLCVPALMLLGYAGLELLRPYADMFSPPYLLRIGEVLVCHVVVFFIPFFLALKYIAQKTELIIFAIVGAIAAGLHIITRNVSVNLSHFMCNDSCAIPLSIDNTLTLILLTTFVVAIATAVTVVGIRLKKR